MTCENSVETDPRQLNYIVIGVVNSVLCILVLTGNVALLYALFKDKSSLPITMKTVMLNLALIDALIGCFISPLFIAYAFILVDGGLPCGIAKVGLPSGYVMVAASVGTMSITGIERYLAIYHPFLYREKFTLPFVGMLVIINWILSFVGPCYLVITSSTSRFVIIQASLIAFYLSINVFCYSKIFSFAKRIHNRIDSLQARLHNQTRLQVQREKDRKLSKLMFMLLAAILIAYIPHVVLSVYKLLTPGCSLCYQYLVPWTWTLGVAKSFFNPAITLYQMTCLRRHVAALITRLIPHRP